jgi:hypothetical protein
VVIGCSIVGTQNHAECAEIGGLNLGSLRVKSWLELKNAARFPGRVGTLLENDQNMQNQRHAVN